ncbi:phosphonopyruvate decarboxylase [Brevibacillus sp. SYSU BS000544]|uniref:phosphonopyruvate decarboxylase n=1 Tax=Brevibacillus sp. SYSU BS000544 TaxID=3416443 RepID=UPI003CE4611E
MLDTNKFGEALHDLGFSFFSGVPCSFLKNLINYAINRCDYIMAANEGDAVAIASGAFLGGRKAVVLMQNSGLTNAVSPLVSLNYPFEIPLLGFISLRGEPGLADEPQHELMGQITTQLLELMQVKWEYLSTDLVEAKGQLKVANQYVEQNTPFFFVVRKGTFAEEILEEVIPPNHVNPIKMASQREDQLPTRQEALRVIHAAQENNTVLIATTGKTSRELYEIQDACNQLYMVGSMGCVSSLGLGLALSQKELDTIIIDGDGSVLMRMGSLATNGYYHPTNMLHIMLDNHAHDSTGGQRTVSNHINFVDIAAACGYQKSIYVHTLEELQCFIHNWQQSHGLTFLYMRIKKGSPQFLARPKIKPFEVKERLQKYIQSTGK